jgi:hypothetical protein
MRSVLHLRFAMWYCIFFSTAAQGLQYTIYQCIKVHLYRRLELDLKPCVSSTTNRPTIWETLQSTLVDIFERIKSFFQRLETYIARCRRLRKMDVLCHDYTRLGPPTREQIVAIVVPPCSYSSLSLFRPPQSPSPQP